MEIEGGEACLAEEGEASEPKEPLVLAQVMEGNIFKLLLSMAKQSKLLANVVEGIAPEDLPEAVIPLPNVNFKTMMVVEQYMRMYARTPMEKIPRPLRKVTLTEAVGEAYIKFVEDMRYDVEIPDAEGSSADAEKQMRIAHLMRVIEVMNASNYMDIKPLRLLLAAWIFTNFLRGKSAVEIRETFGLPEPTPEEKEQMATANAHMRHVS